MLLLARLFVANSRCSHFHCCVFLLCLVLARALHRVFQKPSRLNVIRVYHCAYQYTILERCFDIEVHIRHPHAPIVHALNPSNSRASRYTWSLIISCQLIIANIWHDYSSRDSMSSSHRCSYAMYCSMIFSWVACSIKSRSMLPLIHIKRQKHGINKQNDTDLLPELYSNILSSPLSCLFLFPFHRALSFSIILLLLLCRGVLF